MLNEQLRPAFDQAYAQVNEITFLRPHRGDHPVELLPTQNFEWFITSRKSIGVSTTRTKSSKNKNNS